MNNFWILAQGQGESGITSGPVTEETTMPMVVSDPNAPAAPLPRRKAFDSSSLIFIVLMFAVMYLLLFRGPRKKQKQQQQMVKSLQRNDRVRTIGGVIGTVVDVKDEEITLKVDESNNTKIKIVPSAIGVNLTKDKNK